MKKTWAEAQTPDVHACRFISSSYIQDILSCEDLVYFHYNEVQMWCSVLELDFNMAGMAESKGNQTMQLHKHSLIW